MASLGQPAGQLLVVVREACGPKPGFFQRKKPPAWHLELSYGSPGAIATKQMQPTTERRKGWSEALAFPVRIPSQEKLLILVQKQRKKGGIKTVGWLRLDLGASPKEMSAEREYAMLKGTPEAGPGGSPSGSLKIRLSLAYKHQPGAAPWPQMQMPTSELQARIQHEQSRGGALPAPSTNRVVLVPDEESSALDLTEEEAVAGIKIGFAPPPPRARDAAGLEGMIPKPKMDLFEDDSFHGTHSAPYGQPYGPGTPGGPPASTRDREFRPPGATPYPTPAKAAAPPSPPLASAPPPPEPPEEDKDDKMSFWRKLKNLIGKDLTDNLGFSIPIKFFEPTTSLTRGAELFEHSELLDQAVASPLPEHRACLVAALFVSEFRSCIGRKKPLQSMLGETFEWTRPDGGARVVGEMNESHPPCFGLHAEGVRGWHAELCPRGKARFTGNSLEINFGTKSRVRLVPESTGRHEIYRYTYPTIVIHNLIFGRRWFEWVGPASLECEETGYRVELKYEKAGWTDAHKWEVNGRVLDRSGAACRTVHGRYHEFFLWRPVGADGQPGQGGGDLWRPDPIDEIRKNNPSNMSPFAMELNNPAKMAPDAPPSDSRHRPDMRLMLQGNEKAASVEKDKVEEKQRARRRELERRKGVHQPHFFKAGDVANGDLPWVYAGGYWQKSRTLKPEERRALELF